MKHLNNQAGLIPILIVILALIFSALGYGIYKHNQVVNQKPAAAEVQ